MSTRINKFPHRIKFAQAPSRPMILPGTATVTWSSLRGLWNIRRTCISRFRLQFWVKSGRATCVPFSFPSRILLWPTVWRPKVFLNTENLILRGVWRWWNFKSKSLRQIFVSDTVSSALEKKTKQNKSKNNKNRCRCVTKVVQMKSWESILFRVHAKRRCGKSVHDDVRRFNFICRTLVRRDINYLLQQGYF